MKQNVAIIGASNKTHRYAHRCQQMLMEKQHTVFPVSSDGKTVLDTPGYRQLKDIRQNIDTVTLYVNPSVVERLADDILAASPARVIFNPGTESAQVEETLAKKGITILRACTLVLLSTGQFAPSDACQAL